MDKPLKTFIIYSRADAKFKDELLTHLRPFVQKGILEKFVDSDLLPGEEWEKRIIKELETADLVIMLVSADALNSDFIEKRELKIALEKKQAGSAHVAPILVRDCIWEIHDELAKMQLIPKDTNGHLWAISNWSSRDSAWASCLREIKRLVDNIKVPVAEGRQELQTKVAAPELTGRPEMIHVQGGPFKLGDKVQVTLSDFEIGKYPVTQKLWKEIMENNPSYFKGDDLPVEQVNWNDCQEFVEKLNVKFPGQNFRLPTEAEWEYAARGGSLSKGFGYAGSNNLDEVGWFNKNSNSKTHPVGQKKANELGIYDMSGNVWEWCQDWYGDYPSTPQKDPKGPNTGSYRVLRGGSWNYGPAICRVAHRYFWLPVYRFNVLGFRLARTI